MTDDDRVWQVKQILVDYLRSPSSRHLRDPHSIASLSRSIIKSVDRGSGIWQKWEGKREVLLKAAAGCWVPTSELRSYLNRMPGPALTETDVAQRLKAFEEEPYSPYPQESMQLGCLELFAREHAEGTELPAIIRAIAEYIENENERERLEQDAKYRSIKAQQQKDAEERLLSGADCKWTQMGRDKQWYCRVNGRTYRLTQSEDKKWDLHRVDIPSGDIQGQHIGRYGTRGDATKVIAQVAYKYEGRWSADSSQKREG